MLIAFRKYAIKPYIPRIWANFLDFLAFKRETDELWFQPLSMSLQKRKMAVEVATTHSDSIQLFIENNKRSNDNIEFFRANFITGNRLPKEWTKYLLTKSNILRTRISRLPMPGLMKLPREDPSRKTSIPRLMVKVIKRIKANLIWETSIGRPKDMTARWDRANPVKAMSVRLHTHKATRVIKKTRENPCGETSPPRLTPKWIKTNRVAVPTRKSIAPHPWEKIIRADRNRVRIIPRPKCLLPKRARASP